MAIRRGTVVGGTLVVPTSGGGAGSAPNVTGFTATAAVTPDSYTLGGHFTVGGTTHLSEVRLRVKDHATGVVIPADLSLLPPYSTPQVWALPPIPFNMVVGADVDVAALSVNEDGQVTAGSPSVRVTIPATTEASITATESGTRYRDKANGRHFSIGFTPILNNGVYPAPITVWRNVDGSGQKWCGQWVMPGAGALTFGYKDTPTEGACWMPPANQSWTLTFALGNHDGDVPPTGAKTSAAFTIVKEAAPASNRIAALIVSAPGAGSFPYNKTTPDGIQYFSIPSISYDDTPALLDPSTIFVRITEQDLDLSGYPVGPELAFAGTAVGEVGTTQTFGPMEGAYGTDGFSYVRTGSIAATRFRVYNCNGVDQSRDAWANTATSTLQTGIGGGAGYVDVVVAIAGQTPAGALQMSRIVGQRDNTLIYNGDFEDVVNGVPVGWTFYVGTGISVVSPGATGNNCLELTADGVTVGYDYGPRRIVAHPLESLVFRVWAKKTATNTGAYLSLYPAFFDGAGNAVAGPPWVYIFDPNATAAAEWPTGDATAFYATIATPAGASYVSLLIFTNGLTSGAYWVDNVHVGRQISAGVGTAADGRGGLKFNTSNLSNIAWNPSFENGMTGWEMTLGNPSTYVQTGQSIGATVSGSCRLVMVPLGGFTAVHEAKGHACKPGEQYYLEIWIIAAVGAEGTAALYAEFMNETDTARTTVITVQSAARSTLTGGYHLLSGMVTVPVGASYIRVYFDSTGILDSSYNLVDSVLLRQQASTGGGLQSDGRGGSMVKTGPTIDLDGAQRLVLKDASISEAFFVDGSMGTNLSKWGANSVPYGTFYGLPSPSLANIPPVIIDYSQIPWRVYNRVAGAWKAAQTQPGDLVGGVITALVQLNSPFINGGSLQIASGTVTINIDANNSIKVTDLTQSRFSRQNATSHRVESTADSTRYSQVILGQIATQQSASNGYGSSIDEFGRLFLFGPVGTAGIYLNGVKII